MLFLRSTSHPISETPRFQPLTFLEGTIRICFVMTLVTLHFPALGATLTVSAEGDTHCFTCQRLSHACENEIYLSSKQLDEQAAKLHFLAFGAELNVPTQTQANCTGVEVEGLFKPTRTRSISCRNSSMSKPSSFLDVVFLRRKGPGTD